MQQASTMFLKPFISVPTTSSIWSSSKSCSSSGEYHLVEANSRTCSSTRVKVVCMGMLSPRKFMQRRRKLEFFKDAADEANQRKWRQMMTEIEEANSAVAVLNTRRRTKSEALPKDLVIGTLVRFKQLKKWNLVSEVLEWLQTQHWWDFKEMDFLLLITAYGKLGDFNSAEKVLSSMNKKGYPPHVGSYTALMESYGKGCQYSKAEAIFRRMQSSGPEPSALTYQIILKIFVEGDKFKEAEEVFESLLDKENSPLKPDQKMFHMMIYMYKKAGNYEKARKLFSMMSERGIPQSTVTYNSLMSFEHSYKEVSNIYDQMQRAGIKPDVVSYSLLINAYGRARREEEALAVFEEMLDAGVAPTRKAYNILLDAFAISGMVEQARVVFKSMRRNKCTPDIFSYTTMLSAYINAPDMDGAEKFFKRIKQDGLVPNIVTHGTLIKGYAKADELDKMMEKYEAMRLAGIKPNATIFTTIMDAFGRNKDFGSAVSWFSEMVTSGVTPDQKAKNVLLSLAKTAEETTEANQLIEHLPFGRIPNTIDRDEVDEGNLDDDDDVDLTTISGSHLDDDEASLDDDDEVSLDDGAEAELTATISSTSHQLMISEL